MATESRGTVRPLIERLVSEPQRFDSHQAVRILEAMRRDYEAREAIAGPAPQDTNNGVVDFSGHISLAFPTSDVESITVTPEFRRDGSGARPIMTVNFMGLGGVLGPLPPPYTEFVIDSDRQEPRMRAPRDFLDMFNHRLILLAIESARRFRLALQAPDPAASSQARFLKAIVGVGTPGLEPVLRLPTGAAFTPSLLTLAGLIHQRPVSAHAVERALAAHFGLSAELVPFQGAWLEIPEDQWTVLGVRGVNRTLGTDAMAGTRVWDQSAGVAIVIGPMPFDRLFDFLPGGRACAELVILLEVMLAGAFDIRVRLKVEPATVPNGRIGMAKSLGRSARLAKRGREATYARRPPGAMRLGWTSWLGRRAPAVAQASCAFRLPPAVHAARGPP